MTGRLIAVVGPSGVGKDTVMAAFVDHIPDLASIRRDITRPASAGGEDFNGVSLDTFETREAAGAYALSWRAHGLAYGIPKSEVAPLETGADRLVNLSRAVLLEAHARFDRFAVLSLTARPEVLAERLAARGREDAAGIAKRLKRSQNIPAGLNVIEVDNSGALADTIDAARRRLYPESVTRCS